MGRLKKDHSGWHTSGLWLKYQAPKVNERPVKGKSKKDTNKWCRGKVGVEHKWHRYQAKSYNWDADDYVSPYIYIRCSECRKDKYAKTAKTANYPLHLWIDDNNTGYELVQVRINGEYSPLDYYKYLKDKYWCKECSRWH